MRKYSPTSSASLPRSMAPSSRCRCKTTQFIKQGGLLFEIDPRPLRICTAESAIRSEHAGRPDCRPEHGPSPRNRVRSAPPRPSPRARPPMSIARHRPSMRRKPTSPPPRRNWIAPRPSFIHLQQLSSHRAAAGQAICHRRPGRSSPDSGDVAPASGRSGAFPSGVGAGAGVVGQGAI